MVCTPHQYLLQGIAIKYERKPLYQQEILYRAPPSYNFVASPKRYEGLTQKLPSGQQYNTLQQYHTKYQPQEQQRYQPTEERNYLRPSFELPPVAQSPRQPQKQQDVKEPKKDGQEQEKIFWHDYGLPVYVAQIKEKDEHTMKKQELQGLIQRELESLRTRQMEGTLCAA